MIGIVACQKIEDYRQSILHVGGDVRILESSEPATGACDGIDGVLLTSGGDLAPERYGAQPHASLFNVDVQRDEFELQVTAEARRRGLPILAVCRGIQVLNVALGGTLIQDIPSQVAGALDHQWAIPPHESYSLAHEIWIESDTLLARLLAERLSGADSCEVNSRHHQAVGRVAPGLVVSATAPDGVIEAIEDPGRRFCLGVQWHAENFWRTGEFRALFEDFVVAAGRRA